MNTAVADDRSAPALHFVLKVASRCNLNCSYCYVYNKGDSSWRDRPAFMADEIFDAAMRRIRDHCARSGQHSVRVTFHGGEPCLAGPERFAQWCAVAKDAIEGVCRLDLSVQTNATLIDKTWVDVLRQFGVSVGVSVDGPAEINDSLRVDHAGRGSYAATRRGLELLRDGGIDVQILCVLRPGADSVRIHQHLAGLGVRKINYLLPDHTHETIGVVHELFGPTPCADYLLPIMEQWYKPGAELRIEMFWNMARVILGGDTQIDVFGGGAYRYAFVETNGDIEGLDVLKIANDGLSTTGLHVLRDDFMAIADRSPLHRMVMFDGLELPTECGGCPEQLTCSGGYLPHRFSSKRGLDNPTVWCADMLRLFARMRERLDVSSEETKQRRAILAEMSTDAE